MDALALVVPILLPLLGVPLVLHRRSRAVAQRFAPAAPLPALILALAAPEVYVDLPAVLLGTTLGVDTPGRLFLLFTALVWLFAGGFASAWLRDDAHAPRFWAFFLAAQAGNSGVCLAHDAATFYLLFALMTFAAYGLVVHNGSDEAVRAGRVYLTMAVIGEGLLIAGLLLAAGSVGSHRLAELASAPPQQLTAALLIAGFGIKVGVPLLHMWLPLAHPVAPVPASAVLSGVMLKAGLLGWLRFLPLGTHALPEAGTLLMVGGLAAMFLGAGAGLAQRNPKVLLAYSSISQMGFVTLGVGAGLAVPAAWPLLAPAVALYALHHALAKSALFLGAGLVRVHGASAARLVALAVPALALAGAPATSGMLAKANLKWGLASVASPWPGVLAVLLPLAALGTALLMARFLWLLRQQYGALDTTRATGLAAPWLFAVVASAAIAWTVAALAVPGDTAMFLGAAAPPLVAVALAYAALRLGWRAPALPPGDVLLPLARVLVRLRHTATFPRPRTSTPRPGRFTAAPQLLHCESRLRACQHAGVWWLLLLAAELVALST